MDESDRKLAPFLRNLADSLEHGSLTSSEKQRIGEFYMSYLFKDQIEKDVRGDSDELSPEDFVRFVTIGWYIYKNIRTS